MDFGLNEKNALVIGGERDWERYLSFPCSMLRLAWETSKRSVLAQSKMPGAGTHVLSIEPTKCHVKGSAAEGDRGTLVMLAPGQSMEYLLILSILEE